MRSKKGRWGGRRHTAAVQRSHLCRGTKTSRRRGRRQQQRGGAQTHSLLKLTGPKKAYLFTKVILTFYRILSEKTK